MKNKFSKKTYIVAFIVMLLCITVGFAALNTTLNINGKSSISKNTWDIHFENISVTNGSIEAIQEPTIENNTSVYFEAKLSNPGEYYEYTVDVVNKGSIPAKISSNPVLSGVEAAEDVYLNYTVLYSDGSEIKSGDTLDVNQRVSYKVRIEFDENIINSQLPDSAKLLDLLFEVNYIQQ